MLTQVILYNQLKEKVDFFVKKLSFNKFVNKTGRKLALSLTNILSLALFKHLSQITTKKKLWKLMELKDLATALAIGLGTIGPGIGIGLLASRLIILYLCHSYAFVYWHLSTRFQTAPRRRRAPCGHPRPT